MESKKLSVLKNRSDFLKITKAGLKVRTGDWLILAYRPNELGIVRCGWTIPRKVGNAVIRNKLKRWSRVFFRDLLSSDSAAGAINVDINLVFLKSEGDFYKKLDYERFAKQLDKAWTQLRKRV